jgi:hypothetical protein
LKPVIDPSHSLGVSFAGNELRIRTNSAEAAMVARFVFRWHVGRAAQSGPTLDVVRAGSDAGFQLVVDGELAAIAFDEDELAVILMQVAQRLLICREARHAMLHAALLVRNGHGFLFPAAAGSGKTTLVGWLLGRGFGLLSDELAVVEQGGRVDGLTRPLNIKSGSRQIVAGFEWLRAPLARARSSNGVTLLPWPRHPEPIASIAFAICPSYVPGARLAAEALTPGRFAKEIMGTLLNARNLPKHGLSFASALSGACPAYRITYSDLQEAGDWLEKIIAGP